MLPATGRVFLAVFVCLLLRTRFSEPLGTDCSLFTEGLRHAQRDHAEVVLGRVLASGNITHGFPVQDTGTTSDYWPVEAQFFIPSP